MNKVLLISDDLAKKKSIKAELSSAGILMAPTTSRELLNEDAATQKVDLILLDAEKLSEDLGDLCRALKKESQYSDLPLIILIPEKQVTLVDFSWGFDDYLILPLTGPRLTQRIRFMLWKLQKFEVQNGVSFGALVIDFERYEVHMQGQPVDLTYKEFELLKFLAMNPSKVFSREALLNKVWGYDFYGGTRTVDVHVRRLRSKIEVGGATYVETVRNVGYKFVPKG